MPVTERLGAVDDRTAGEARELWDRAHAADEVAAVSEAFALAVGRHREGVVHVLRRDDAGQLVGYAQVASVGTPDAVAELVVDPAARRQGHGRALLDAVVEEGARSVWAHGDLPPARAFATAAGLERTRSLHLMTRPLGADDARDPALPAGYSVRAFEPGRDDEDWVRLNAAAFASHPEQGRLTVADLRERMDQPWFDPAGFLLVERDGRVVAFHWTKVEKGEARHGNGTGEVYVVGVDPDEQGRGLGGPLTALGLAHLARRGLTEVHLYVDGDNTAARRTYERLGFADLAVDAQYSVPHA
ncbi:mycothiol synthase [uncultured Phycicoccus sp.]|uniref:mycothiol synthase n=1 Tax=uncultured Phycicoccus sp. TaxID=661422 RepID=UPI00261CDAC1|nr:mycothiol synthase [uncultured Phycicoccus sp.]